MTHPAAASTPQLALEDEQIRRCYQVLSELRPHVPRDGFVDQVRAMQPFGYRLAFIQHGDSVVTVAGYRIGLNFHLGRHLYVEDLVSAVPAKEVIQEGLAELRGKLQPRSSGFAVELDMLPSSIGSSIQ